MKQFKLILPLAGLLFLAACEDKAGEEYKTGSWNFDSATSATTFTSNIDQNMVNSQEMGTGSITISGEGLEDETLQYVMRHRWPEGWAIDFGFSNAPFDPFDISGYENDNVIICWVSIFGTDVQGGTKYFDVYYNGNYYYGLETGDVLTPFTDTTPLNLSEVTLTTDNSYAGMPDTLVVSGSITPAFNTLTANTPTELDMFSFGFAEWITSGSLEFMDDGTLELSIDMDYGDGNTEMVTLAGEYELTDSQLHIFESDETVIFDYTEEGTTITLSLTEDMCDGGDCNDIEEIIDATENTLTSVETALTLTLTKN